MPIQAVDADPYCATGSTHGDMVASGSFDACPSRESDSVPGFEIYRVMRFSGIKLGAGINQNW